MKIRELQTAVGRGLANLRRAFAARRRRSTDEVQHLPMARCDLPSCTIALVGITQATGVLVFDFRSR